MSEHKLDIFDGDQRQTAFGRKVAAKIMVSNNEEGKPMLVKSQLTEELEPINHVFKEIIKGFNLN